MYVYLSPVLRMMESMKKIGEGLYGEIYEATNGNNERIALKVS